MRRIITVTACSLNQWALDFTGNVERILSSVRLSRQMGARFRSGPELEIPGYGCNDHFLEVDTERHSWEALGQLLKHKDTQDMLIDVGMPVTHNGVRYNCRVFFYNGKILLIRPKKVLAEGGNYREARWFSAWTHDKTTEEFHLPHSIFAINGQATTPLGDALLQTMDVGLGVESCEELFAPHSSHADLSLAGAHVIANGSASHHEVRKLHSRVSLILNASSKSGGVYIYSNLRGCDGERLYYDGTPLIALNGRLLAQGPQFSLADVSVVSATINLDDIAAHRASHASHAQQAASSVPYPRVHVAISLTHLPLVSMFVPANMPQLDRNAQGVSLLEGTPKALAPQKPTPPKLSPPLTPIYHSPSAEISLGPACWLWDYLRRSRSSGFFLPLSGGIDSAASALVVFSMCRLVMDAVGDSDARVLADLRTIVRDPAYTPASAEDICNRILHTCYMSTTNSSAETNSRASRLATLLNTHHTTLPIDTIVASFLSIFTTLTGRTPKFKLHGGSHTENLALQNLQARIRMVTAYFFAQLSLWTRGRDGSLLVLGSGNADECLRGYLTKYDCSSADLNPIGSISKLDLRGFVAFVRTEWGFPILDEFLAASPTAELEPCSSSYTQTDEVDMGMTYAELQVFGMLRTVKKCGPFSMVTRLAMEWGGRLSVQETATKVMSFFHFYAINRHKMTVLPPAYHISAESPDDNRFDLRPFLYPDWSWQLARIKEWVAGWAETHETRS